jgi:hypothetical protein
LIKPKAIHSSLRNCTDIFSRRGKLFDAADQFHTDIKINEIDVPENVRLVVGRRLERLDENEKLALAVAAVIGCSFSFQLLNGINQIDVDELFTVIEKAQRMGIIVPSAEGPERDHLPSAMNSCVRRYSPRSRHHVDSDCMTVSLARWSSSIPMSSTSASARQRTISSKQDPSLTTRDWSDILRLQARQHSRRQHSRKRGAVSVPLYPTWHMFN